MMPQLTAEQPKVLDHFVEVKMRYQTVALRCAAEGKPVPPKLEQEHRKASREWGQIAAQLYAEMRAKGEPTDGLQL